MGREQATSLVPATQPYCEGIRRALPLSPATQFIRKTAKSSFRPKPALVRLESILKQASEVRMLVVLEFSNLHM